MTLSSLSTVGKVAAGTVSLIPLYWTVLRVNDTLTPEGQKVLNHPLSIATMAYGTIYGAVGDSHATVQTLCVTAMVAYYILVQHPEIGDKYFAWGQ